VEGVADQKLQEEVHEAQRKIAGQEEEIKKLKAALASRPRNPDARVLELQQELQGYKLIAGTHLSLLF
jgi:centromeric protein E